MASPVTRRRPALIAIEPAVVASVAVSTVVIATISSTSVVRRWGTPSVASGIAIVVPAGVPIMAVSAIPGRRRSTTTLREAPGAGSSHVDSGRRAVSPLRDAEVDAHLVAVDFQSGGAFLSFHGVFLLLEVDESESTRTAAWMVDDELDLFEWSVLLEDLSEIALGGVEAQSEDAQTARGSRVLELGPAGRSSRSASASSVAATRAAGATVASRAAWRARRASAGLPARRSEKLDFRITTTTLRHLPPERLRERVGLWSPSSPPDWRRLSVPMVSIGLKTRFSLIFVFRSPAANREQHERVKTLTGQPIAARHN
ncbi:hypothetical protein L596_023563 [Steinernema carpocapsae]|uniref:Uncharacterized protein n=1 Tax=Steinernema carpocapsae TaxID=34508 RepID=A0A4U5ME16_STECR|nr:hypothetical protein L596_023563 [Steinernema carpocapsae]